MHLLVVDPEIRNAQGHRLHYARALLRAATMSGARATVLVNRGYVPDAEDSNMVCLFRRRSFETNRVEQRLRRLSGLSLPWLGPLGEIVMPTLRSAKRRLWARARDTSVAEDLFLFLAAHFAAERDRESWELFFASISPWDVADIIDRAQKFDAARLRLHFLLLYDVRDFADGARALVETLRLRDTVGRVSPEVRFLADTDELAATLSETLSKPVRRLPVFVNLTQAARRGARGSRHPLRISFLGDSRVDKGFKVLPGIIEAAKPLWATGKVRFIVQASSGGEFEQRTYAAALKALKRLPAEAIELVEGVLARPLYEDLLFASDIVLAPYDPSRYRLCSSGIVAEALAAGVPALVPAGTWMATQVGDRLGRTYRRIEEIPHLLETMVADYDRLRGAALAEADERCREGSARAILQRLTAEGNGW